MIINYDLLDWLGEQAAMEIGREVVLYEKKPSKNVGGVEYVWNEKRGLYGRWARNKYGGAFFTPLEETGEEAAQNIGNSVHRGLERRFTGKQLSKDEIEFNMELNKKELAPILASMGREILPDAIYGEHVSVTGSSLRASSDVYFGRMCEATVDLYEIVPGTNKRRLVQRRIFGPDGFPLQDIDYVHNNDTGRHIFPHIHVWINKKRNKKVLKYRKK